jgi:prepilin-type N-terminal cleavage/methylation domain-containing protein
MTSAIGKKENRKGFTLIEVMVASVVLAIGIVLVYEAFFLSLDSFNYSANYLEVIPWLDEEIWLAQDNIRRLGDLAAVDNSGDFINNGRTFNWSLNFRCLDIPSGLYALNLDLCWREGRKEKRISRTAYARYEKEKKEEE